MKTFLRAAGAPARLAAVAGLGVDLGVDAVPLRVWRRAQAGGWATCDVCRWPVDPAAVLPARRPRHPGCVCCCCDAPLTSLAEPWHPQCRSIGRARLVRVIGGRR